MADKPKTTGRVYSHKMYMNSTGYPDAIGRPGDKDYDIYKKRPHSDDKKPYRDDEYPEMEHFWTPYDLPTELVPPGVPDDPRIPPMNPDQPPDGFEGGPDRPPGEAEFLGCGWSVPIGPKFIPPGGSTWRAIGMDNPFKNDGTMDRYLTDPLVTLYVGFGPADLTIGYVRINKCMVSMQPVCLVGAIAKTDFDKDDYHKLGEFFPVQVVGITRSGWTCAWDFFVANCPPAEEFEWDLENSAETIVDSGSAVVMVTGGMGPFSWEIKGGTGFTFLKNETSERSNTLLASAESCGTAKITVTDICDNEVEGTVQNVSSGRWQAYADICGAPLVDSVWDYNIHFGYGGIYGDKTVGGQRQKHLHLYDMRGRIFTTEQECEEANSDCGEIFTSLCMPYPGQIVMTSHPYAGTYFKCGSGKDYKAVCTESGSGAWRYNEIVLRTDYEMWVHFDYYEWEC